jgi:hypothetical protein
LKKVCKPDSTAATTLRQPTAIFASIETTSLAIDTKIDVPTVAVMIRGLGAATRKATLRRSGEGRIDGRRCSSPHDVGRLAHGVSQSNFRRAGT